MNGCKGGPPGGAKNRYYFCYLIFRETAFIFIKGKTENILLFWISSFVSNPNFCIVHNSHFWNSRHNLC